MADFPSSNGPGLFPLSAKDDQLKPRNLWQSRSFPLAPSSPQQSQKVEKQTEDLTGFKRKKSGTLISEQASSEYVGNNGTAGLFTGDWPVDSSRPSNAESLQRPYGGF